jgi:ABC-2 type transport system permease protein
MRNVWTIASKEYDQYFASPIAYMVIFVILFVVGIFFYLQLQAAYIQQFAPGVDITAAPLAALMMLSIPALTTRTLAEERRTGTIELLLTAPVRDWELVVGKWLGVFLLLLTIIAITLVFPLVLNQLVSPGIDQGQLIGAYLGLILVAAALSAVGVFISSLFSNQIAAFATTLGVLILLWWVIGPIAQTVGPVGRIGDLITYLNFNDHFYSNMLRGILDLKDVIFYLSVTALCLFLGTMTVETRRWR